jgi:hypothetical protein
VTITLHRDPKRDSCKRAEKIVFPDIQEGFIPDIIQLFFNEDDIEQSNDD